MKTYDQYRQDILRSKVFDAIMTIAQEENCSYDELMTALEWVEIHIDDFLE